MEAKLCLNCAEEVSKKFCPNCGQKADTNRIVFGKFLKNDLIHGVWHLEKGILFTVKEALVRPGKAALDYIAGKRIRYYNVFYLCLLLIGLHVILASIYDLANPARLTHGDTDIELMSFLSKYLKFLVLGIVPVVAINAYFIFKRLKLNLAEHFVLSGINLLGILIVALVFLLLNFINGFNAPDIFGILEVIFAFLIVLYPFWTYGNAAKGKYKIMGLFWRLVIFNLMIYVQLIIILLIINNIFTSSSEMHISL